MIVGHVNGIVHRMHNNILLIPCRTSLVFSELDVKSVLFIHHIVMIVIVTLLVGEEHYFVDYFDLNQNGERHCPSIEKYFSQTSLM
jgi:hypothetical protein